jgi:hypothetical protein
MKLFTKDIDKKLFAQFEQGSDLENQMVVAKIFNPYGRGVWYIINSDPSDPDYLWAIVDLFEVEAGSVSRSELESIKVPPFRLPLERDMYFTPINAAELYRGLLAGKRYAEGGEISIEAQNKDMLLNYAEELEHHVKEFEEAAKKAEKVMPWVIAKIERSSTDLSDVTHYLASENEKRREYGNGEGEEKYADGGEIKWQDAHYGDNALVIAENKMGLIIKPYGRKFHLKFPDGTEKTYDASELKFFGDMDDFDRGGKMASGGRLDVGRYYKTTDGRQVRYLGDTKDPEVGTFTSKADGVLKVRYDEIQGQDSLFAEGGEMEEGVDLFEDYDNIPSNVQMVLQKYPDAFEDGDYKELEKANKELGKIGYTFEYGLDGQVYDLRKIGEKGKSEYMAKGGEVPNEIKENQTYKLLLEKSKQNSFTKEKVKMPTIPKIQELLEKIGIKVYDKNLKDTLKVGRFPSYSYGYSDTPIFSGYAYKLSFSTREGYYSRNSPSHAKKVIEYIDYFYKNPKMDNGEKMAKGGQTDFGDFYEWSSKEVSKKFNSQFDEGFPIVKFVKDSVNKVVESASGVLKNGKTVVFNVDSVDWEESDKMASGGMMAKGGKTDADEVVYIEFLNAKKGFSKDKKYFRGETAYNDAVKWGRKNIGNFNMDMVKFEMAKGGEVSVKVGDRVRKKVKIGSGVSYGIDGIVYEVNGRFFKLKDKYGNESNKLHDTSDFKQSDIKSMASGGMTDPMAIVNEIARLSGVRPIAIAEWGDKNNINLTFVLKDLKSKKIKGMDIMTAIVGNPNNKYQKELSAKYSKMAMGGKVKFADKVKSIKKSLLERKKVSPKVQKDYGKTYSPKEAEESANRIVGAMTAKERLMAKRKKSKK